MRRAVRGFLACRCRRSKRRVAMKRLGVFLILIVLCGLCPGEIIYVDADAKGLNNGNSWTDAYVLLQSALMDAGHNDEIWVAEGTYYPTFQYNPPDARSAAFRLKNGVEIYGGFDPGSGVTAFKNRKWTIYPCILSGDIGIKDAKADNCYHVFYHPLGLGLNHTALMDGFYIEDGNADGVTSSSYGGGMFNEGSSPGIVNCCFRSNFAYDGGGVYNLDGSAAGFANCEFISNQSLGDGGGVFNDNSDAVFNGCTFGGDGFLDGNTASYGGGISSMDSDSYITDCTFQRNKAELGGAVYNYNSNGTINECTFQQNKAQGASFHCRGGAIALYAGSAPSITGGLFTYNLAIGDAQGKGGGIYCDSTSQANASEVRFENNISHDNGGAIYLDGGTANLDSGCVLYSNDADKGAGVYCVDGATLNADDCTFEENSADEYGGAAFLEGSTAAITNCEFLTNDADNQGGALAFHLSSGGSVSGSTFTGNMTNVSNGFGGAVYCNFSTPNFSDCGFQGNSSHNGGAVACEDYADIELLHSTVTGNTAVQDGGGVSIMADSSADLESCLIADNESQGLSGGYGVAGGLGVVQGASAVVKCCTIANNISPSAPSGVYSFLGSITVSNSIIWGHTGMDISGDSITVNYSDIEGGFPGTGNIDLDPMFLDAANGDYHLTRTSPCVDAGNNAAASGIASDMDGEARIIDGDGDMTATVDMGADELPEMLLEVWVDDDYSASGGNDGHEWGVEAFSRIQDGVDAVGPGGTVYVGPGVYIENVELVREVALEGAGAKEVLLDGYDSGPGINADGITGEISISGFTVFNGSGFDFGEGATGGGGLHFRDSNATIWDCILRGNRADYGGALEAEAASVVTLVNCLVKDNTAGYGGAFDIFGGSTLTIINSTVVNNTASGVIDSTGGSINCESNSDTEVFNSIIRANIPDEFNVDATSSVTAQFSNIEGGWPGTNIIDLDPKFADGPGEDFRLDSSSPCVDAGSNPLLPVGYTTDLNGLPRIASKLCGVGPDVDMGAYEFNRAAIGDFSDDCVIDYFDFALLGAGYLGSDASLDVYPPGGDGIIDIHDAQVLGENWLERFE